MSTSPSQAPVQSLTAKTNTLAIAALISSFIISVLGIVLGHIALNQIKRTGENGRGLAIAALVIGYVAVGITVLVIIIGAIAAATVTS